LSNDKFAKKWGEGVAGEDSAPFSERVKDAIRPPRPLKPRIDQAVGRIELQIQRLTTAEERFSGRDKSIFAKIVDAYQKHDMRRANIFANELAEIRKMEEFIMYSKLALEQVVLRLRTVTELGDIVVTLAPAMSVLRRVRSGVSQVMPRAERELGSVGNMLSGIIIDAGQTTGMTLNFDTANEDARSILNEAALVAEQKMKEKFPELPSISATKTSLIETETHESPGY
jgi:division protein CdvB (Snf7/Vps24/ESCRT-III family)